MNVLEAIRTKRAVRQFTDQPIPEETLAEILHAGRRAQSSRNTQPWFFVVVRERETLEALSQCGRGAGHLADAAVGLVIVSQVPWLFDIGQAAAYLQLAAWELGVSSCLASLGDPDRAKTILGVPAEMHLEMALSFGYAAVPPTPTGKASGRRPLEDVVRWEKFS